LCSGVSGEGVEKVLYRLFEHVRAAREERAGEHAA